MRTWALLLLLAGAAAPALAAPDDNRGGRSERVDGPERSQRASTDDDGQSGRRQFSNPRLDRGETSGERAVSGLRIRHQQSMEGSQPGAGTRAAETEPARGWRRGERAGASAQGQSGWQPRERRIRTIPDSSPVATATTARSDEAWRSTGRRHDGHHRRWSTSHWRGDSRYDWRRHRDRHRSLFRLGYYYDPFGWNYRRWHTGSFLYPSYYSSRYWLHDPWYYRLPSAYGSYRWVRYWNDALLVDIYTGEVVDVIRGFFW